MWRDKNEISNTEASVKSVTADDIVSSIEMILGRTPDKELVEYHLGLNFQSRAELGEYMMSTQEFTNKHRFQSFQPIFLGDRVLTHTHAGDKIYLIPTDLDLTPSIMTTGRYESELEHLIRSAIQPGDTVVDIGANVGYHTLAIASAVGPHGHVFAFEANPEVHRLLLGTLVVNGYTSFRSRGRVNLYNMAVTDFSGPVTLSYAPMHYGSGNIVTDDPQSEFGPEYTSRFEVPGVALDELLANHKAVDLIHADIEGAEPLALRGARNLIRRSPNLTLITEWSVHMMRHLANVDEHIALLVDEGFRFWKICGRRSLLPIPSTDLLNLDHCDLLISRSEPIV